MISRKLLTNVLKYGSLDIVIRPDERYVWYTMRKDPEQTVRSINIYELAHKCIIWAAKQNFKVEPTIHHGIEKGKAKLHQYQEFDIYDTFGYKIGRTAESDWFEANSIPEAIFEACEWILKKKDENEI